MLHFLLLPLALPLTGLAADRDLALAVHEQMVSEQRVALVIGNGAYTTGPLRNPRSDAEAFAEALGDLGFDVTARYDVTQKEMKRALIEFGASLSAGGVGLFYYAGHGMQVGGRNYLIPVDAVIEGEADVDIEGVDAGAVLAKMDIADNRLNLVILDACRNNPFERSFRSSGQGLAMLSAPSGTLVAYATAPGSVAADENSYTQTLLRHIHTPGVAIEDVFKAVRRELREQTDGQQVPWESSSLEGDFYFSLPQPTEPHPTEPQPTEPAAPAPSAGGPTYATDKELQILGCDNGYSNEQKEELLELLRGRRAIINARVSTVSEIRATVISETPDLGAMVLMQPRDATERAAFSALDEQRKYADFDCMIASFCEETALFPETIVFGDCVIKQ